MFSLPKKPFLFVFDLDGTLTKKNCWHEVLVGLDKWIPLGEKNLNDFLTGKMPGNQDEQYIEFCKRDAALLANIPYSKYLDIINQIPLRADVEELIAYIRKHFDSNMCLISAGLWEFAERVAKELKFNYYIANQLFTANGSLNGNFKVNVGWYGKKTIMKELVEQLMVKKDNIVAFGDSEGDIGLFEHSGLSFAIQPSKPIKQAHYHLQSLTEAIPVLEEKYSS